MQDLVQDGHSLRLVVMRLLVLLIWNSSSDSHDHLLLGKANYLFIEFLSCWICLVVPPDEIQAVHSQK